MLAARAIPNVGFAILAARNNPTAVGCDEYLFDGAIGDFFCVTLGLLLALGWYRAPPALSTMASGAGPIR